MYEMTSKTINMRTVEINDADFILSLRTNAKYNKFLSNVTYDVDKQKEWIINYKNKEVAKLEFYFIIETKDGKPCGTVRLYDFKPNSFCWGSWILNEDKTKYAALESAFLVYQFGFDVLGFRKSHFDVRKENSKVVDFHKKFGAQEVGEDTENYYFEISKESVDLMKKKFLRVIS